MMGGLTRRRRVDSHSDRPVGSLRALRYLDTLLTTSQIAALGAGGVGLGGSVEEPEGRPAGETPGSPPSLASSAATDPRGDLALALDLAADMTCVGGPNAASAAHWSPWTSSRESGSAGGAPGALMRRVKAATLCRGTCVRARGSGASAAASAGMTRERQARAILGWESIADWRMEYTSGPALRPNEMSIAVPKLAGRGGRRGDVPRESIVE